MSSPLRKTTLSESSDNLLSLCYNPRLRTASGPTCPPSAAGISAPRATASTASDSAASSGEQRTSLKNALGGLVILRNFLRLSNKNLLPFYCDIATSCYVASHNACQPQGSQPRQQRNRNRKWLSHNGTSRFKAVVEGSFKT